MANISRSIVITQIDPNSDKFDTTFKRANPNATDIVIKQSALKLCSLTRNTFVAVTVVDYRDITDVNENEGAAQG